MTFREREALRAGVEDLLQDLAAADDPEDLLTLAGQRLEALFSPQTSVIHAPIGNCFTPVFARGTKQDEGPPTWWADAVALVALRARIAPPEQWASAAAQTLAPAERAALDRLRAAVILPVCRGADLVAIICLGEKRSGDVYTANDLELVATVADKVSNELLRFDTAFIRGQERRMGEALRGRATEPVAAHTLRRHT